MSDGVRASFNQVEKQLKGVASQQNVGYGMKESTYIYDTCTFAWSHATRAISFFKPSGIPIAAKQQIMCVSVCRERRHCRRWVTSEAMFGEDAVAKDEITAYVLL